MEPLPEYENPPVAEVAIGVQFIPLKALTASHVGLYWQTIRDTFPRAEERPPIAHTVESTERQPFEGAPSVQWSTGLEMPRAGLVDSSESDLLQIQKDRFLYNWRRKPAGADYPRYPAIKSKFLEHWSGYRAFLKSEEIGPPEVDQLELTYVNHIEQGSGWDSMTDLGDLFTAAQWSTRGDFLLPPETFRWAAKFLIDDGAGRLHVEAVPMRVVGSETITFRFMLTARGKPAGEVTDEGIGDWFDRAREWIVRGFAALVAKPTDALWGRRT